MIESDPWTQDLRKKEEEEENLIAKGGIHPYPWEAIEWEGGPEWRVVDTNKKTVVSNISQSVAKAITETFNRNPIVILEDDVVY